MVVKIGGFVEVLLKMSFGNRLGFEINNKNVDLFSLKLVFILIEIIEELLYKNVIYLGEVIDKFEGKVNGENINLEEVEVIWLNKLKFIFLYKLEEKIEIYDIKNKIFEKKIYKLFIIIVKLRVVIVVFLGINFEYDMYNRFNENGGEVKIILFRNLI